MKAMHSYPVGRVGVLVRSGHGYLLDLRARAPITAFGNDRRENLGPESRGRYFRARIFAPTSGWTTRAYHVPAVVNGLAPRVPLARPRAATDGTVSFCIEQPRTTPNNATALQWRSRRTLFDGKVTYARVMNHLRCCSTSVRHSAGRRVLKRVVGRAHEESKTTSAPMGVRAVKVSVSPPSSAEPSPLSMTTATSGASVSSKITDRRRPRQTLAAAPELGRASQPRQPHFWVDPAREKRGRRDHDAVPAVCRMRRRSPFTTAMSSVRSSMPELIGDNSAVPTCRRRPLASGSPVKIQMPRRLGSHHAIHHRARRDSKAARFFRKCFTIASS